MKSIRFFYLLLSGLFFTISALAQAPHSVARKWNEVLLQAIREDYARPTVHARNLFHVSMAMYDAWAAYDSVAAPFFLDNILGGFACPFQGVVAPANLRQAREEAISYAAYRLLKHRFKKSPGAATSLPRFDSLFIALGYDSTFTDSDYTTGKPAALGNYLAEKIIAFGLQDGSNEQDNYANKYYTIANSPIAPDIPGNPYIRYPNRWQPITLEVFVDQSGNQVPGGSQPFLGPNGAMWCLLLLLTKIKPPTAAMATPIRYISTPAHHPLSRTMAGACRPNTSGALPW